MSKRILKSGQVNMLESFEIIRFDDYPDKEDGENFDVNFEKATKDDTEDEGLDNNKNSQQDDERIEETQEEIANKKSEEIISKALEESKEIIENANLEAKNILKEAKENAEEIKNQAHQLGYMEAKKEQESFTKKAEEQLNKNIQEYANIILKAKNEIIMLAISIAKKVVSNEIKTDHKLIVSLAKDALRRTLQKDGIILKVSPEDRDILEENLSKIAEADLGKTDLKVEESSMLKKGDLLVQTDFGVVDGSASKKMSNIEKIIEGELGDKIAEEEL